MSTASRHDLTDVEQSVVRAAVAAVCAAAGHAFSKQLRADILLVEGLGVAGDAHLGVTVMHRSRVAVDPTQPNLRQVHLMHEELFEELAARGHTVRPGDLGENITTRGVDLLALPRGTLLTIGSEAVVEVTGLRNPCKQIDDFQPGLLSAVLHRDVDGNLLRKAGIMSIVRKGGRVRAGDPIIVTRPAAPFEKLERV